MPTVTDENEGAVPSRRPREGLRSIGLVRAKRLRNDRIKARSPLLDNCHIECQNTASVRNLLQIRAVRLVVYSLDSELEPNFPY